MGVDGFTSEIRMEIVCKAAGYAARDASWLWGRPEEKSGIVRGI